MAKVDLVKLLEGLKKEQAEIEKKIAAAELLLPEAEKANGVKTPKIEDDPSLTAAIKAFIVSRTEPFTSVDVRSFMIASHPTLSAEQATISAILARFKGELLEVVTPGIGRRPTVWKKI